jgi:hypothetical protein
MVLADKVSGRDPERKDRKDPSATPSRALLASLDRQPQGSSYSRYEFLEQYKPVVRTSEESLTSGSHTQITFGAPKVIIISTSSGGDSGVAQRRNAI